MRILPRMGLGMIAKPKKYGIFSGAGQIATLIDVATPTNKTTAAGRQAYLDKRREGHDARANLVEIDLVRQGKSLIEYSRDGLPEWDYAVTVTRATEPERHEIYTSM